MKSLTIFFISFFASQVFADTMIRVSTTGYNEDHDQIGVWLKTYETQGKIQNSRTCTYWLSPISEARPQKVYYYSDRQVTKERIAENLESGKTSLVARNHLFFKGREEVDRVKMYTSMRLLIKSVCRTSDAVVNAFSLEREEMMKSHYCEFDVAAVSNSQELSQTHPQLVEAANHIVNVMTKKCGDMAIQKSQGE